ncbi:SLAC1 anion channel family protein [Spirochaetia bacterium 38H-sp]|uniref:SLAC1 anion channel family protein n=1 Tax=Rarispira pelagica TaxID=3141764 RepID=A0ABU9UBJ7_9SPIR
MNKTEKLKQLPVSLFSIIMGLGGFTIVLQRLNQSGILKLNIGLYLLWFTALIFSLISLIYLAKLIKYPRVVQQEFANPIAINFFPSFSIAILLLALGFATVNQEISKILAIIGIVLHFLFTVRIISVWMFHDKFEIVHMNPAWFIPPVGNIIIPLLGSSYLPTQLLWFFFSVGIFFWFILLVIFFNRIIFHHPLPDKLLPTKFILIAPPAVGFIAFAELTGTLNPFSYILYYFSLFWAIILFSSIRSFLTIKFELSWWAYSFPLAAISLASLLMTKMTGVLFFKYLTLVFAVILSVLIVYLVVRTTIAIVKKKI